MVILRKSSQIFLGFLIGLACGCGHESRMPVTAPTTSATQRSESRLNAADRPTDAKLGESQVGRYVSFVSHNLRIRQPVGFVETTKFAGFTNDDGEAVIRIEEIAQSERNIHEICSAETLKARGAILRSKDQIQFGDQAGMLFHYEVA